MKNKIQIIIVILCIIIFNTVKVRCTFKESGNARVEMTLSVKGSAIMQALDCIGRCFLNDEPAGVPQTVLSLPESPYNCVFS
ncbi:MAG: hypothetical protein ABIQ88_06195 [Chitinophagaceae bacterium]